MEEIKNILLSLIEKNENEYVEYKEAKNNFDFNELGRYFSALSNGANLQGNFIKSTLTVLLFTFSSSIHSATHL